MKIKVFFTFLLALSISVSAQWVKTYAPDGFTSNFDVYNIDNTPVISNDGSTFYTSVDGGSTWENANAKFNFGGSHVNQLVQNGSFIYGCTRTGLFYSEDKAKSWKKINLFDTKDVRSLHGYGDNLLVQCNYNQYFYSSDKGATWNFYSRTGIPSYSSVIKNGTVLVFYNYDFFEVSIDFGKTWTTKTASIPASYIKNMVFAGNDLFLLTNEKVYKSSDLGNTWIEVSTLFNASQYYAITAFNDELLVSTNLGIFTTSEQRSKADLIPIEADFITPFYSMSVVGNFVFANAEAFGFYKLDLLQKKAVAINQVGTYFQKLRQLFTHRNKIFLSSSKNFFYATSGEAKWKLYPYLNNNTNYLITDSALVKVLNYEISVSYDAGLTWKPVESYRDGIEMAISELNNIYLLSPSSIYYSADRGETWEEFNPLQNVFTIKSIHAAADNLYLFTSAGIFVSTDHGKTASLISTQTPLIIANTASFSVVNHKNADFFFLIDNEHASIYYSYDYGKNWNITNLPTTNYLYKNIISDGTDLYVSTNGNPTAEGDYICALVSKDNSRTWRDFGTGIQAGSTIISNIVLFDKALFEYDFYGHIWKRDMNYTTEKSITIENAYLRCFPNPVSNYIEFELSNYAIIESVRITDIMGKTVYQNSRVEFPVIDISFLPKGIYVLSATIQENTFTSKFVKE